jgi:hypothetical protein
MADITNPGAIRFCNEKVRPIADLLEFAYLRCKATLDEWNARQLGVTIPVSAAPVVDGAASDGRPVLDGNAVNLIMARCQDFVTDYEANSKAKLNTVMAAGLGVWRQ